jgi:hypothetical protein
LQSVGGKRLFGQSEGGECGSGSAGGKEGSAIKHVVLEGCESLGEEGKAAETTAHFPRMGTPASLARRGIEPRQPSSASRAGQSRQFTKLCVYVSASFSAFNA